MRLFSGGAPAARGCSIEGGVSVNSVGSFWGRSCCTEPSTDSGAELHPALPARLIHPSAAPARLIYPSAAPARLIYPC